MVSQAPPRTLLVLLLAACVTPAPAGPRPSEARPGPVSTAPNWKERLEQPYVYLEHRGDYREVPRSLARLCRVALDEDLPITGAPFALFYDDPARTPTAELRARVCLPVETSAGGSLPGDLLPRSMVVYRRVTGDYRLASRAYPDLFAFLAEHRWSASGPVRESYLVDPSSVGGPDELVCEVQIPWRPGTAPHGTATGAGFHPEAAISGSGSR